MRIPPELLAIGLLLGIALGLAAWFLSRWRRTTLTFPQFVLLTINKLFTRLLWRATISGPLPVPPGCGAVIVSNHRSSIEPLLIQMGTDRVVHWLVASEYVEHPALGWIFRILRSIPVKRRGVDTAATKMAIRLAQQGQLVAMFPEGRINSTSHLLLPGRPGAALIALKAAVPVVPCYVDGAPYDGTPVGPFFMPARVRVHVGRPIDLTPYLGREGDKDAQREITKLLLTEIAALAGVKDYEPRLAGKVWGPAAEEEQAQANGGAESQPASETDCDPNSAA